LHAEIDGVKHFSAEVHFMSKWVCDAKNVSLHFWNYFRFYLRFVL